MLVSNTVYQPEKGQRKQLTMEGWAASALSDYPNISKGLTAYECLLMENNDLDDQLTQAESRAYRELESEIGEDIKSALDDLVRKRIAGARDDLAADCDYADPFDDVYPTNVYVIESLESALPGRGIGGIIEDAVAYMAASPWTSRIERLTDLQDLQTVAGGDGVPSDASDFVRAVADGDSKKWDVENLHSKISPDIEFWERNDLDIDDLHENYIKQNPSKRSAALETAATNQEYLYDIELLKNLSNKVYTDVGEDTSDDYAEMVDLEEVNDGIPHINIDTSSLIDELLSEALHNATSDALRKIDRMEDYVVASFEEDPRELDGKYMPEDGYDVLGDILNMVDESGQNTTIIEENRDRIKEWAKTKKADIRDIKA